jgi:hypothetical protein
MVEDNLVEEVQARKRTSTGQEKNKRPARKSSGQDKIEGTTRKKAVPRRSSML